MLASQNDGSANSFQFWLDHLTSQDTPVLASTAKLIADWKNDENASLDSLAEVVSRDVTSAARTLRIANSAYYNSTSQRLGSVQQAVATLGANLVLDVCLTGAIIDSFSQDKERERVMEDIAIAVNSAIQTTTVAELQSLEAPNSLYTRGLIAQLGSVAFWCFLHEAKGAPVDLVERALEYGCSHDDIEWDLLDFPMTLLSELLAQQWGLVDPKRTAVLSTRIIDEQEVACSFGHQLAVSMAHRPFSVDLQSLVSDLARQMQKPEREICEAIDTALNQAQEKVAALFDSSPQFLRPPLPKDLLCNDDDTAMASGGNAPEVNQEDFSFDRLEMVRGAAMEAALAEGGTASRSLAYCGANSAKGILVMPGTKGGDLQLTEGLQLRVHGFNGKFDYEFSARVLKELHQPAHCWLLEYPRTVSARVVRAEHRVSTALQVDIRRPGKTRTLSGIALDLSKSGILIASDKAVGVCGDSLKMEFSVRAEGSTEEICRLGTIRHVREHADQGSFRAGIVFEGDSSRNSGDYRRYITAKLALGD